MILESGSTGTNGSLLVEELVSLAPPVRAMVRTPEKASSVERKGVEAVVADFSAPETLDGALEGVERAFLVTPPNPRETEWERNFVDAGGRPARGQAFRARGRRRGLGEVRAGPRRVRAVPGGIGPRLRHPAPDRLHAEHARVRTLRCLRGQVLHAARRGEDSPYDVRDAADVTARALTEEGHEGKVYELTGPEAISNREITKKLSAVLGKPVEHVEVSLEDAREGMVGAGLPEWLADGLIELNREVYEPGYAANVTRGVAEATGRKPRSFK